MAHLLLRNFGAGVLLAAVTASTALALDLKTTYEAALVYDAELLGAKAVQEEAEAGVPAARAALLPQLSYSYQKNQAETTTNFLNSTRSDVESGRYNSFSNSLYLRQALFRKPAWDALQGAKAQAEAAESGYEKDTQSLGLRVVSTYLEVLSSRVALVLTEKQTLSTESWVDYAEKSFKAGRGTRTDIEEARTRRDNAKAKETEANMYCAIAVQNFEVVSGLDAKKIPEIDPRLLDPNLMLVENKDQWFQRIEVSNPDLQTLRKQLEAAKYAVAQAQGGHLPTLDLVAAQQYNESDTNTTIGTGYATNYVGLQLTIPLISGGSVLAQTRQAKAREENRRQALESNRRKILAEAEKLYLAMPLGIEQLQAFKQAVFSAEQTVLGVKKEIKSGTRTLVDALDADRRLFEAKRDYAFALYSLANNRMKFLALARAVDIDAIENLSVWLASAAQ